MGAIGEPITPSIPTVGSPGPGFATDINAILQEVVDRLSAKVPLSSVDFGSDLNMAGSKILDVGYITIQGEGVSPVSSPVNRITTFGGDFWFVGPAGAVKITSGALLNAAGIGGITGDYGGANPAQFRFDDLNQRYDAYDNFGTGAWAFVRALGFDVAAGATSTVFARLLFAGASNKTYTLPATAASSADRPVYIDSSGVLKAGHANVSYHYDSFGSFPVNSSGVFTNSTFTAEFVAGGSPGGGMKVNAATTTDRCLKPLDGLAEGYVITTITFHLTKVGTTNTRFELLAKETGVPVVSLGTVDTTTIGASNPIMTLGAAHTVAASKSYYIQWFPNGGSNGGEVWHGFTVNGTMAP